MIKIDVTRKVRFQAPTGERLPVTKCVCGAEFHPGAFVIGINPSPCQKCGRRLCWNGNVRVYEVRG